MAIRKIFRNGKYVYEKIDLNMQSVANDRPATIVRTMLTEDQIRQAHSEVYTSPNKTDVKNAFILVSKKLGCTIGYLQQRFAKLKLRARSYSDEATILAAFDEIYSEENGLQQVLSKMGCTESYLHANFRKLGLSGKFSRDEILTIHEEIWRELSKNHRTNICEKYKITWNVLSNTFRKLGLPVPPWSLTGINWNNITDLGKIPDADLARKLKVTRERIRQIRLKQGIPKFKESALVVAFRAQVKTWLKEQKRFPHLTWISAKEGKIYIRLNAYCNTLTLANFVIKEKYWGRGIARSLIHEAITQPVQVVRIESISKDGWFSHLKNYNFPGYETKIIDQGDYGILFNIDFIRK